jgi:outer membrane lipoprotein-sorting protein
MNIPVKRILFVMGCCALVVRSACAESTRVDIQFLEATAEAAERSIGSYEMTFRSEFQFMDAAFHADIVGDGPEVGANSYRMVFAGPKWRREEKMFDKSGKPLLEVWTAVDGQRRMTFSPLRKDIPSNRHPNGVISSEVGENDDFGPNTLLPRSAAFRSSLSSLLRRGRGRILYEHLDNQPPTVAVQVEGEGTPHGKVVLVLDASKGFSVITKELYRSNGTLFTRDDNIMWKRIGGAWFPVSGDESLYLSRPNGKQYRAQVLHMQVDDESIKVNQKTDADLFELKYPNGTLVLDKINGISYVVGAQAMMDHMVKALKKDASLVRTNGHSSSDAVADSASDVSRSSAAADAPRRRLAFWVVISILGVAGAVRVVYRWRHEVRHNP